MTILIVEDELYLAQSIANKLIERGYECEFAATVKEALAKDDFEVVLLSTNVSGQNFLPVIQRYRHAIVILMVNYINNDTVSTPLNEGAKDYILKPFMIEELVRKIEHFREFERLKRDNNALKIFKEHTLSKVSTPDLPAKLKLPLMLKSTHQLSADAYAFACAKSLDAGLVIFSAAEVLTTGVATDPKTILFLTGFEQLKKADKEQLLALAADKSVLISSLNLQESYDFPYVEIKSDAQSYNYDEVMDIEEYIKFIITNFQEKYPDTELSKKLGISRKSLWEKRKKYDIFKHK